MLTVSTLTNFSRTDMLDRMQQSVALALPGGAKHLITHCAGNYAETRMAAMLDSEYVAIVDDDDTISADSLQLCMQALDKSGAGVAFTDEVVVDVNGVKLGVTNSKRTYFGATLHPRAIHHLCVIKREAVNKYALELHNKFGIGIDWFIKAGAALTHGAIHVPIEGYFWTQHPNQMYSTEKELFRNNIVEMGKSIRKAWPRKDELIPTYNI